MAVLQVKSFNKVRVIFCSFFFVLTAAAISAQAGLDPDSIRSRYSKYNAVITQQEEEYVFDLVKDTVQVRQNTTKEVFILNSQSKAYTNDYIYYGSFCSVEDIQAYTMVPKGRGYEKIKVARFNESHDRDGSIFYDDSKTINFAYPSLTDGALTTLKYTVIHHNPRFLNKYYFQSFIPVISSKVIVKVHKDIKIGYKLFNGDLVKLKQKTYSSGNYNYYVWEATNLEPYKYLNSDYFNVMHFSPHIALYIEEAKKGGKVEKYYSTIDDLYRFYYQLISKSDTTSSPEMRRLVKGLTAGLNDRDKAKAIYYWVEDNIKYIAYSDGFQGFIPAPSDGVFSKRFGDCKGMAGLIRKMMNLAGLKAYLAWVGTRSIPYTYEECPLPATDNHMITAFQSGDSTILLDGTFSHLDFGMNPYAYQGKEALISLDKDKYMIYKVPVSSSLESTVYDSVSISLSGNAIKGNGTRIHTGFNKMELVSAMDGVKETDYIKKLSTLFSKGSNKFMVDTYNIASLFEHDKPAEVSYTFTLDDYARVLDKEIYINLNLDKSLQNSKIDTTIQYSPVANDFYFTQRFITRFNIPEGYEIEYLPENSVIGNNDIKVSFDYYRGKDYVVLEKKMVFDFLLWPYNKVREWNSIIDRLNSNYRLSLVLRKKQ